MKPRLLALLIFAVLFAAGYELMKPVPQPTLSQRWAGIARDYFPNSPIIIGQNQFELVAHLSTRGSSVTVLKHWVSIREADHTGFTPISEPMNIWLPTDQIGGARSPGFTIAIVNGAFQKKTLPGGHRTTIVYDYLTNAAYAILVIGGSA